MATFELTLISASIPPHVPLDLEPEDTYAIIRCAQEQQRSKTTHDHGRTPVWNETFAFNLGDQDVPKFVFVQIFAARSDTDEFLGVARIPIFTSGETEGSLHVLVSPDKGETGKLKAVWRWKSMPKQSYSSSPSSLHDVKREERDYSPGMYPPAASPYDEVTGSMAKLAVHKGQDRELYPPTAYGSATYPPPHEQEERSSFTSEPYQAPNDPWKTSYPPPNDMSKTSYPPSSAYPPPTAEAYPPYSYPPTADTPYSYPPTADAYPPYHDYQEFSSSSEGSYVSSEREREKSPSSNTRGLGDSSNTRGFGDSKDKGHHSHHLPLGFTPPGAYGHHSHHSPHGYAPPGAYGGGYPPPAGYTSPYGPSGAYPSAPAYSPAPAYPPAPYGAPPAQYGYPPSGYPPQAPYPTHTGHGSYAPVGHGGYPSGMYVGHSSHGKHGKHHKMPKHSMYGYGQMPAQYGHYKHKKHKGFGKGFKLKKYKGFKKFKF